ncbi:DUF423 domain-containing protein [Pigmentiphaga soli]|uniref:DUF423 domain-containing protein n=1 Tax=Pigmentiphaga soli TaxID=1007095 RepID=A0ABP8HDD0_9BURK
MLTSSRVLLAFAAPMGAAGVILAAMATHLAGGAILSTAALFLLLHACAVLGLAALMPHVDRARPALTAAAVLLIAGTLLFSGDLALRQLAGVKLLWGTAPFGGGAMIVGWLCASIPTFFGLPRQ